MGSSAASLPWLTPDEPCFPHPDQALDDPDGLLAAGGALTKDWLLLAYSQGIFPWFNDDADPILWWSPAIRGVIYPQNLHVSGSLAKHLRRCGWTITLDQAFDQVAQQCADLRANDGTWITPQMHSAYVELHNAGYAHSVEVWHDTHLVGGIYGVSLGRMFFGESMFSAADNGSKVALLALAEHLTKWDFELLDCQMLTPHLTRMGAVGMPRGQFVQALHHNRHAQSRVGNWQADRHYDDCQALYKGRKDRANALNPVSETG